MQYDDRSIARLVRAILAVFLLASTIPALASESEQTLIVPPGAASISLGLPPFTLISAVHGPFHGQLTQEITGLTYQPGASFADARADIMILELTGAIREVRRIRVVAGEVALDGEVAILGDLTGLPPTWESWVVDDPARQLEIEAGLFGDAYAFDTSDEDGPRMVVILDDGNNSGSGTTTSATHLDVEVRDLPNLTWESTDRMTFFQILDNGQPVGGLDAEWIDNGTHTGWRVLPTSVSGPPLATGFALQSGVNRLRVRRWTHFGTAPPTGGLELFLNDVRVAELPAAAHDPDQPETHEIQLTNVPGPGDHELVVQNVLTKRSQNTADPTTRLSYEPFNASITSDWVAINPVAQSYAPQDLPGDGDRLELDLGLVAQGHSSYLEKAVPLTPVEDPPGFALRFWLDPTAVSLKAGTALQVATACTASGSCEPARIWLGHDGDDVTIAATAWRNGGSAARVETPVANAPHLVEVRLRHGWLPGLANGSLELWIDGVLVGRETGIDNHTAQINKLRLGILTDAGASSGILGFDDYEAWRFE
ncbi:MAG: hypothetical protein AAF657_14470 [Acidobacteriota bacterium]